VQQKKRHKDKYTKTDGQTDWVYCSSAALSSRWTSSLAAV